MAGRPLWFQGRRWRWWLLQSPGPGPGPGGEHRIGCIIIWLFSSVFFQMKRWHWWLLQSIGLGVEHNGTHPMPMLVPPCDQSKMGSVEYCTKFHSASVRLYLKPSSKQCFRGRNLNLHFDPLTHWQSKTTDSPPTKKDNICLAVRRASLAGSSLLAAWNLLYSPTFRPLFPTWWDAKNIMKIANGTDNNGGGQTIPDKQCWWQQ